MSNLNMYARWQAQFNEERARLLETLGAMTAGGIAEQINHIGATSVPGLPTQDKAKLFDRLLDEAHQWWVSYHGFGPVQAVAQELESYLHPWYISSGWALDLFIGQPQRVHHDSDIVVRRSDQLTLQQHLLEHGWQLLTPLHGKLEPWPRHMLLHLPRHQVHARRAWLRWALVVTEPAHLIIYNNTPKANVPM